VPKRRSAVWIDGSTVKMHETKDLPKLFQKAGEQLELILSVGLLLFQVARAIGLFYFQ